MRWSIVFLIFRREVRDQIRDRRTLFMIFVLPILLYPILGIGSLQLSAALDQEEKKVVVVGVEHLPERPPLLNAKGDGFDSSLFGSAAQANRLLVKSERGPSPWLDPKVRRKAIQNREVYAVVVIPADLRRNLDRIGEEPIPISYESTDERSQFTYLRVKEVLSRWKEKLVRGRLEERSLPANFTEPIEVKEDDVASEEKQGGGVWSRLFPFLLVMMALTGAFYPAVDLCAGEKERGTMETLLISPASRGEIVMGKFLTVVLASMTTAMLNLASMGLTGVQIARQISSMAGGGGRRGSSSPRRR